jgi:hypothetical protein
MDGTVLVLVGPAQLRATGKTDEALDRLGAAVNPFRDQAGGTALKCGVIRLPVQDGVARVERSIAMETAELGVSATGTRVSSTHFISPLPHTQTPPAREGETRYTIPVGALTETRWPSL